MELALSILKKNRLSNTDSRRAILEVFLQTDNALAHHDIEKITGDRFDRVTVYRTLQTFIDNGIIHTIPTADNATRYALCRENCSQGHHHDNHVHFICEICGKTTCLDDTHIPSVKLPRGYSATEINMIVNGVCKECK
jgi:Fur family transcriptional regulator, ferric uptake regulator